MIRGKGIKRTETVSVGMPCVRYGEIYTSYNTEFSKTISFIPEQLFDQCNLFHAGDLIFTLTGENKPDIAKAVAYFGKQPVAAGGDLAYWTAHGMNPLYLVFFMACPYCIEQKRRLATGDIIVHISTEKIGSILVPIPPKAEQDRIVSRIQEIAPFLQEYDKKENTLSYEQQQFPDKLKKSILQMAVQGKLVPQDPADEPASVLLERIRAEKERLIREGKIKRDKNESVIFRRDNSHYEKRGNKEHCLDDEIPFEIPDSWCWSKLGTCMDVRDGTHDTPKYVDYGVPLVTSKNLSNGQIDFSTAKLISKEDSAAINQRSKVDSGDILFAMIGSIGNPVLYYGSEDFSIKNMALFKQIPSGMDMEYVFWFLMLIQDEMKKAASGGVQAFVSLGFLRNYLIPVPPVFEQKRICKAVKQTLPLLAAL